MYCIVRALSAATHLLYVWLAVAGKSIAVFCVAVACDTTANAMGAAAFVAFRVFGLAERGQSARTPDAGSP